MPSYNYKCPQCEAVLTVVRSMMESDPGYTCDACNIAMNRVYSVGAITFNGSGFYSKDK
jgi:putative FmdB family regulatory protein